MSLKKPVVHQVAWGALVIQVVVIQVIVFLFSFMIRPFELAVNVAIVCYLILFILLRNLIPRNHRRGIRLVRAGNYAQAAGEFEKSYEFFTKHAWIDKYRYLLLFSGTRMTYQEMALINSGFCYAQIGEGRKARAYYEKALKRYPDNEMAKSALRMMDSAASSFDGKED